MKLLAKFMTILMLFASSGAFSMTGESSLSSEDSECSELLASMEALQRKIKYSEFDGPISGIKRVAKESLAVVWHPAGSPSMILYLPLYGLQSKVQDTFGDRDDITARGVKLAANTIGISVGVALYPIGYAVNFSVYSAFLGYHLGTKSYDQFMLNKLTKKYKALCSAE